MEMKREKVDITPDAFPPRYRKALEKVLGGLIHRSNWEWDEDQVLAGDGSMGIQLRFCRCLTPTILQEMCLQRSSMPDCKR